MSLIDCDDLLLLPQQILEKLDAIDPFLDIDKYTTSLYGLNPPRVESLPERQIVDKWLQDVESIAAETERFDQGDMNRLKEFAKSPWLSLIICRFWNTDVLLFVGVS